MVEPGDIPIMLHLTLQGNVFLHKSAKIFGSVQSEPKVQNESKDQSEPNIFLSTLGDVPMSLWGRDV